MSHSQNMRTGEVEVANLHVSQDREENSQSGRVLDFLQDGIADRSIAPSSENRASSTRDQHLIDAATLGGTELRKKYAATYNTWRNMKQRRKHGAVVAPEFEEFKSFLRHVGPRPAKSYTLDRIDNEDPTYGPGRVRWADKRVQANNRSTTIFLTYNNRSASLSEWARLTNQKADTLRNRRDRGWSDAEVIEGIRAERKLFPGSADPGRQRFWEEQFKRRAEPGQLREEFLAGAIRCNIAVPLDNIEFYGDLLRYLGGDEEMFDREEEFEYFLFHHPMDAATVRAQLKTDRDYVSRATSVIEEATRLAVEKRRRQAREAAERNRRYLI